MKRVTAALLAAFISLPGSVLADDVTDQINEALRAYQAKDLEMAVTALDAASTLIRQQRAAGMADLLPPPLAGWVSEEEDTTTAANANMLGGGINAERVYRQQGDDYREVRVNISGESMLVQSMGMLFGNPMFMGGSEQKLVVIDGRKVIQNSAEGSLTTLVNNKALVVVSGSSNDPTTVAAVKSYFKAINFTQLEAMLK